MDKAKKHENRNMDVGGKSEAWVMEDVKGQKVIEETMYLISI